MLGRRVVQGLIFVVSFAAWDFYVKQFFYSLITSEEGSVGLAEVAFGYAIVFGFAYITSNFLAKQLKLDEKAEAESRGYGY